MAVANNLTGRHPAAIPLLRFVENGSRSLGGG
jgi:hypothetical protein